MAVCIVANKKNHVVRVGKTLCHFPCAKQLAIIRYIVSEANPVDTFAIPHCYKWCVKSMRSPADSPLKDIHPGSLYMIAEPNKSSYDPEALFSCFMDTEKDFFQIPIDTSHPLILAFNCACRCAFFRDKTQIVNLIAHIHK